jgi:hypothetical protein
MISAFGFPSSLKENCTDFQANYMVAIDVASDPSQPDSTVLILSGFDSSDPYSAQQAATCELNARWPSNYGDVYFGADGCLYDSGGNRIFDQCCSTPDSNNNGPTINPYKDPRPAPTPSLRVDINLQLTSVDGGSGLTWDTFDYTPPGTYAPCTDNPGSTTDASDNISIGNPPFPPSLTFNTHGLSNCQYTGSSSAPGTLNCPGFSSPVQCTQISGSSGCIVPDGEISFAFIVTCQF